MTQTGRHSSVSPHIMLQ